MDKEKITLTVNEASAYTGIGRNTIRQLISWNKIPIIHIGRKMLIRRDALDNFLLINEKSDLRDKNHIISI